MNSGNFICIKGEAREKVLELFSDMLDPEFYQKMLKKDKIKFYSAGNLKYSDFALNGNMKIDSEAALCSFLLARLAVMVNSGRAKVIPFLNNISCGSYGIEKSSIYKSNEDFIYSTRGSLIIEENVNNSGLKEYHYVSSGDYKRYNGLVANRGISDVTFVDIDSFNIYVTLIIN